MMPSYKEGQVVFAKLGKVNTSEIVGHEQGNGRPVLIVKCYTRYGMAIIVPFTTNTKGVGFPTNVLFRAATSPLKRDSIALCHHVRSISFDRLEGVFGEVDPFDLEMVKDVLIDIFG